MAEQINKSKLDALLGIQEGQSFEDYMGDVASPTDDTQSIIDQTTKLIQDTKSTIDGVEEKFKDGAQMMDVAKAEVSTPLPPIESQDFDGSASKRIDTLVNVENAFKSIEDLVDSTKQMLVNVYSIISSCDVLDSETVGAAAALIGETRQLIAEYTSLFKQRIKFFDNVKMETLKQQHRKELLQMKYDLDEKKWNLQHTQPAQAEVVEGQNGSVPPGMVEGGTMDILSVISQMEDEDDDDEEGANSEQT